jgi:hypothetical protein
MEPRSAVPLDARYWLGTTIFESFSCLREVVGDLLFIVGDSISVRQTGICSSGIVEYRSCEYFVGVGEIIRDLGRVILGPGCDTAICEKHRFVDPIRSDVMVECCIECPTQFLLSPISFDGRFL